MVLYCRLCDAGHEARETIPPMCPACQRETRWSTMPARQERDPLWAYTLTAMDRRMLRAFRIGAD